MWLLDAKNLWLEDVADKDLEIHPLAGPRYNYAILSHRWEDAGEPTFEQYMKNSANRPSCVKIEKCCEVAQIYDFDFVWVDTCCIDKRSSAHLQEAINSMYRYYERAAICVAYLRDVRVDASDEAFHNAFVKSEWFTRGWTLQELLAPSDVEFYNSDWKYLGTKKSLSSLVFAATGIPADVLHGVTSLHKYSVAQRMSWAARRVTTRFEDRAYSLLGIFDVNMTMLYGEGSKAFLRLQEEILKTLDDHSIFAWKGLNPFTPGLLASSPEAFAASGNVKNILDRRGRRSYAVNNRGVHGLFQLYPYTLDTYLMLLPCTDQDHTGQNARLGIFLRRLYEDDQFMRVSVNGEDIMENASDCVMKHGIKLARTCLEESISIRQNHLLPEEIGDTCVDRTQGFRLNESLLEHGVTPVPVSSVGGKWNPKTRIISLPSGAHKIDRVGSLIIGRQGREIYSIKFGFDMDYNPTVHLTQKDVRYSESSWSSYRQLSTGKLTARMTPDCKGCWALRADRINGLDVHIVRTDQRRDKTVRLARIGRVQLHRTIINGSLLWDLQIDELAPRGEIEQSWLDDGPEEYWPYLLMNNGNAV